MFRHINKKGFTLIELLIAMAVSSAVMAVIYSTYRAQLRSQVTQQALIEMQQNARAAMYAMERDIRLAGYDPDGSQSAGITKADPDTITFTISAISDGIDNDSDGKIDLADDDGGEVQTITYDLVDQNLERNGNIVAENIEVLNFVYLDDSGAPTAVLANIRSVQVTIIARSGENVPVLMMQHTDRRTYTNQQGDQLLPPPNDNFRRILLTADLHCRNQGL